MSWISLHCWPCENSTTQALPSIQDKQEKNEEKKNIKMNAERKILKGQSAGNTHIHTCFLLISILVAWQVAKK